MSRAVWKEHQTSAVTSFLFAFVGYGELSVCAFWENHNVCWPPLMSYKCLNQHKNSWFFKTKFPHKTTAKKQKRFQTWKRFPAWEVHFLTRSPATVVICFASSIKVFASCIHKLLDSVVRTWHELQTNRRSREKRFKKLWTVDGAWIRRRCLYTRAGWFRDRIAAITWSLWFQIKNLTGVQNDTLPEYKVQEIKRSRWVSSPPGASSIGFGGSDLVPTDIQPWWTHMFNSPSPKKEQSRQVPAVQNQNAFHSWRSAGFSRPGRHLRKVAESACTHQICSHGPWSFSVCRNLHDIFDWLFAGSSCSTTESSRSAGIGSFCSVHSTSPSSFLTTLRSWRQRRTNARPSFLTSSSRCSSSLVSTANEKLQNTNQFFIFLKWKSQSWPWKRLVRGTASSHHLWLECRGEWQRLAPVHCLNPLSVSPGVPVTFSTL